MARPTVIMLNMNIFLKQFVGFSKVIILNIYEQLFLHNNWAKFQWFYKFEQHFIATHGSNFNCYMYMLNICFIGTPFNCYIISIRNSNWVKFLAHLAWCQLHQLPIKTLLQFHLCRELLNQK